jgi:hypothetical protein
MGPTTCATLAAESMTNESRDLLNVIFINIIYPHIKYNKRNLNLNS